MAAVSQAEAAAGADVLSVLPQQWPPPPGSRVLMQALTVLRQNTAAGYLAAIQPGSLFWASAADAPNLLANSQAAIAPAAATLAPEPPYTVSGILGIGAGTSNASR